MVLLSPSNFLKNFKPLWNRCVTVFLYSLTYFLTGISWQYSSLTFMCSCLEEHGEICFSRKKLEGKQHLLEWENACMDYLETQYHWASRDAAGPAFWCRDTEVVGGGGWCLFFHFSSGHWCQFSNFLLQPLASPNFFTVSLHNSLTAKTV